MKHKTISLVEHLIRLQLNRGNANPTLNQHTAHRNYKQAKRMGTNKETKEEEGKKARLSEMRL